MQNPQKSAAGPLHVGVLLFDGFSNHCLANAVEPLRAANSLSRRPLYAWQYLTLDGAAAVSSSGLQILPQAPLHRAGGGLLLVMPSYGFRQFTSAEVGRGLRAAAQRFDRVAGLDTGAWPMAAAGLLDGCRATIHWEELTAFAEAFPQVTAERSRFVIDGRRITCSGAMASFDLLLHLISVERGPLLALEVERMFMAREDRGGGAVPVRTGRGLSRAAAVLMQAHLEEVLPLPEVAARLKVSERRLEQELRRDLNLTPQRLYLGLRLSEARRLAETTDMAMAEVALRCGYRDVSAMIRAYRQHFGQTPGRMRQEMRAGRRA